MNAKTRKKLDKIKESIAAGARPLMAPAPDLNPKLEKPADGIQPPHEPASIRQPYHG